MAFSHISLLTSLLLLYIPSYVTISLTPFYTTHAPYPPQQQLPSGNNKTIHNQGVGERSDLTPCMIIYSFVPRPSNVVEGPIQMLMKSLLQKQIETALYSTVIVMQTQNY